MFRCKLIGFRDKFRQLHPGNHGQEKKGPDVRPGGSRATPGGARSTDRSDRMQSDHVSFVRAEFKRLSFMTFSSPSNS